MQNKIQYLKSNIQNQNKGFTSHLLPGNKKNRHLTSCKKGAAFTLVEILVTILIFSLIISVAMAIFVSFIRHQKRVLAKQELLNQTSYVTEYMSRALRMAKKDSDGSCLSQAGLNFENPLGDISRIKFINHLENDVCQEFSLEGGQLKETRNGNTLPLTSSKFQINSLCFNLLGESQNDTLQPKVTIFMEIQVKGAEEPPKIKIQTTISQRNLDVPY